MGYPRGSQSPLVTRGCTIVPLGSYPEWPVNIIQSWTGPGVMIVVFWYILPEKMSYSGPSEASAASEWVPSVTPASVSTHSAIAGLCGGTCTLSTGNPQWAEELKDL